MNGFLVFVSIMWAMAVSGPYQYALPGMYPAGREMIIHSENGCGGWQDIRPVEDIEYSARIIDAWTVGITFEEAGMVNELTKRCSHGFMEYPVDVFKVGWEIRADNGF